MSSSLKIDLIIKSEFHSNIDDTIINRLADALFCENSCHESFWADFKFCDAFPIDSLIRSIDESQFSHPNIIRMIIAVYCKDESRIDDIENIIISCINHEDPDYSYTGLWCCLRLIPKINFNFISEHLFEKYLNNNNVIFEPIYENILSEIYFKSIRTKDTILFNSIERIIFENISGRVHLLIAILQKNIEINVDMSSIMHKIEDTGTKAIVSHNELLYSYILCPQPNLLFENSVYEALLSLNDKKLKTIIKTLLHLSNGRILSNLLHSSKIASFLWNKCFEIMLSDRREILKYFLSLGEIDIKLFPGGFFSTLMNTKCFDIFKNVIFNHNEILETSNYFQENEYRSIFNGDGFILLSRFFYSIFANKHICVSLCRDSMNGETNAIRSVFDNILKLIRASVETNLDKEDFIDIYLVLIKFCLTSEHLDENCKIALMSTEMDSLITLQYNTLIQYITSECMDILSIEPIKLAKEISLMCIRNKYELQIKPCGMGNITRLMNVVTTTEDLYDNSLCECILFCALCCCNDLSCCNQVTVYVEQFLALEITISIKDYLDVLEFFNHDVAITGLLCRLKTCNFKKDLQLKVVDERLRTLNRNNIALEDLKFDTYYCNICKENIDELIEDIVMSAKPMECFGD